MNYRQHCDANWGIGVRHPTQTRDMSHSGCRKGEIGWRQVIIAPKLFTSR